MKGIGSGDNGEITFLDCISIISFLVGLENLEINVTQESLDRQTAELDEKVNAQINKALADIHGHLKEQDSKIDQILFLLGRKNDSSRNF